MLRSKVASEAKHARSSDLRGMLDQLEEAIEAVRLAYEKYFAGIDRMPPTKQRAKLERLLRSLEMRGVTNTVLRFRLGGLRARFVTYKHYWTRVEGELERGTSRRDRLRNRRSTRLQKPAFDDPRSRPSEQPTDPGRPQDEGKVPPPPPLGKLRAKAGARVDPAASGIDPSHLRDVFKQLVAAKRAAGESTEGLTYASLVRKLAKAAPQLKEKHGCEKLEFSVSTRGGKVRLRSAPK